MWTKLQFMAVWFFVWKSLADRLSSAQLSETQHNSAQLSTTQGHSGPLSATQHYSAPLNATQHDFAQLSVTQRNSACKVIVSFKRVQYDEFN